MHRKIKFRSQLINVAKLAGIRCSDLDPDYSNWDIYGKFELLCATLLHKPLPYVGFENDVAKIIANLQDDEVDTITAKELAKRGVVFAANEA